MAHFNQSSLILILMASLALVSTSFAEPRHRDQLPYPVITPKSGANMTLIKQGEYLTRAGDCVACHTVKDGKPFAGGLGIRTPFGTYYAPNITPDKKHGLGTWTEDEFIRAMKQGIRKDGGHLFPVFPYLYYNKVTDQDLKSIWAYLQAIPAINKPNKPIDAWLPFRIRFSQLFWKLLFFKPYEEPFRSDPNRSKDWNRGAYLVQGLGHCSMCHTPLNLLGAPKRSLMFTGGHVDGYYAPNLTDTLLKSVTVNQLTRVFYHDELPGGGKVQGPMAQVNHDSLAYLKPDDIRSIAIYIKSLKDPRGPMAVKAGTSKAQQTYTQYCGACHDSGAAGAPKLSDNMAWAERLKQGKKTLYVNAIKGYNAMPAKGNCLSCTDQDIEQTVDYILKHAATASGVKIHQIPVRATPQLSWETGQRIYDKHCSTCHNGQLLNAPQQGDVAVWEKLIKKGVETLFTHTLKGYRAMPAKGGCVTCSPLEVIASVKYLLQTSLPQSNFSLW